MEEAIRMALMAVINLSMALLMGVHLDRWNRKIPRSHWWIILSLGIANLMAGFVAASFAGYFLGKWIIS